jgi:hypothetical protein
LNILTHSSVCQPTGNKTYAKVLQDWKAGQPLLKWGNNLMYNQDLEGKMNLDVLDAFLADV